MNVELPEQEPVFCQLCGGATQLKIVEDRLRPVCESCGSVTYFDPKLSAAVIIVREGRVLLGNRAEGARESGKWSFPAGFVERGEPVHDAAIRETREEVGIEVTLGRLVGVYSEKDDEVVLVVYSAAAIRGEAVAGDDMELVGWFSVDDLPELAFPRDRKILEDWASLQRDEGTRWDQS